MPSNTLPFFTLMSQVEPWRRCNLKIKITKGTWLHFSGRRWNMIKENLPRQLWGNEAFEHCCTPPQKPAQRKRHSLQQHIPKQLSWHGVICIHLLGTQPLHPHLSSTENASPNLQPPYNHIRWSEVEGGSYFRCLTGKRMNLTEPQSLIQLRKIFGGPSLRVVNSSPQNHRFCHCAFSH